MPQRFALSFPFWYSETQKRHSTWTHSEAPHQTVTSSSASSASSSGNTQEWPSVSSLNLPSHPRSSRIIPELQTRRRKGRPKAAGLCPSSLPRPGPRLSLLSVVPLLGDQGTGESSGDIDAADIWAWVEGQGIWWWEGEGGEGRWESVFFAFLWVGADHCPYFSLERIQAYLDIDHWPWP